MNDYKEVILFEDGVEYVYFKDVEGFIKSVCFGRNRITCSYVTDGVGIFFTYNYDGINGNYIVARKYDRHTFDDIAFNKGELEKFYYTDKGCI